MLRVALRALRSRRTQSVTLILLAALVTAAAVAAPFYVYAATDRLIVSELGTAPAVQRQVTVSQHLSIQVLGPDGLNDDVSTIATELTMPGFANVTSARVAGSVGPTSNPSATVLSQRDDVCNHVVLTGACPDALDEVMLSTAAAASFNVAVGGTVRFESDTMDKPLTLHVVGLYTPRNAADPYWGQSSLALQAAASSQDGLPVSDAVFTTLPTVAATKSTDGVVDRDMILGTGAISVNTAISLGRRVINAESVLPQRGYRISSQLPILTDRIVKDTNTVFLGVPLGAAQLVLFGWFALFLCIRATARARRFDVGILKLRGLPRRSLWMLMTEQSTVPVLVGAPFGAAGGFLGARAIAGPVATTSDLRLATVLAVGVAVATVVGGLIAALIAERSALATQVVELLRTTPSGRRGWRADVVDFIIVAIAIAGVVQIHNTGGSAGSGLAVLAPGLVALAVGLLAARALTPLAARAVSLTRRAGRVRGLLTATYLARRPGLDRIFALVAIAVALSGYSILAWTTSTQARTDRAELEVGPARVMTVSTVPPSNLMQAVRAADPSGRYAMAVTQFDGGVGRASVLAVDSSRLANVFPTGPGLDRDGAALAKLLRPSQAKRIQISGTSIQLSLDASGLSSATPAYVLATLIGPDGPLLAGFGPLQAGEQVYSAATPTCSSPGGCALVGFQLSKGLLGKSSLGPADPGTTVVLRDLRQQAPVQSVLTTAVLSDENQWRATLDPGAIGPTLGTPGGGLSISIPAATHYPGISLDPTAYAVTSPTPVPVVAAGSLPVPPHAGVPSATPFGIVGVPIRVVATEPVLPRIEGNGVLMDLSYAQALSATNTGAETSEVWLSADAPKSVVRALATQGLVTTGQQTIAARSRSYADQASVIGLRFQVLGGAIGLALAAVALLVVSSVERDPRAIELVALRHQGVAARATHAVARRGYTWLAGAAVVAGLVAAIVDRLLSGTTTSLFSDGWRVLPKPPLLPAAGLILTLVVTVATFAVATALAAYQLIRAVRTRGGGTSR